jgi:hypothetical protein
MYKLIGSSWFEVTALTSTVGRKVQKRDKTQVFDDTVTQLDEKNASTNLMKLTMHAPIHRVDE